MRLYHVSINTKLGNQFHSHTPRSTSGHTWRYVRFESEQADATKRAAWHSASECSWKLAAYASKEAPLICVGEAHHKLLRIYQLVADTNAQRNLRHTQLIAKQTYYVIEFIQQPRQNWAKYIMRFYNGHWLSVHHQIKRLLLSKQQTIDMLSVACGRHWSNYGAAPAARRVPRGPSAPGAPYSPWRRQQQDQAPPLPRHSAASEITKSVNVLFTTSLSKNINFRHVSSNVTKTAKCTNRYPRYCQAYSERNATWWNILLHDKVHMH